MNHSNVTDEVLIPMLRDGSYAAFTEIHEQYYIPMVDNIAASRQRFTQVH